MPHFHSQPSEESQENDNKNERGDEKDDDKQNDEEEVTIITTLHALRVLAVV